VRKSSLIMDPTGHPGQDLGRSKHNLRPGSHLELGKQGQDIQFSRVTEIRVNTKCCHRRLLVPPRLHVRPESLDLAGTNAFGRWHYGPWFNPPVPECVNGAPLGASSSGQFRTNTIRLIAIWFPGPRMHRSLGAADEAGGSESLHTGRGLHGHPYRQWTAYPVLKLEPKAYRFRILNAANDRMLNLQLYKAADKTSWTPGTGSANPGTRRLSALYRPPTRRSAPKSR